MAAHYEGAIALVRFRRQLLRQAEVAADRLRAVERPLQYHLYALSRLAELEGERPRSWAGQWVYLASLLLSRDSRLNAAGRSLAADWLANGGQAGSVARDVLILCPRIPMDEMAAIYQREPAARLSLWEVWRRQCAAVPRDVVGRAVNSSSRALRLAAWAYLAERPEADPALFTSVYRASAWSERQDGMLAAALWGGLLRNDPRARDVLEHCLHRRVQRRPHLIRMAALTGEARFFPAIRRLWEQSPGHGAILLAFYGGREAMPLLLEGMAHARTMEPATRAWRWLTGTSLAVRPRLRIVGGTAGHRAGNSKWVANVRAARRWWLEHSERWPRGERRLFGQVQTVTALTRHALAHGGAIARHAQNWLSLYAGPLQVDPDNWLGLRKQALLGGTCPGTSEWSGETDIAGRMTGEPL